MKRKTKLISWLVAGCFLGLGPVWSVLGGVVGMFMTIQDLSRDSTDVGAFANRISLALWTTAAGWIAFPIGVVIIVISVMKMDKLRKEVENGYKY